MRAVALPGRAQTSLVTPVLPCLLPVVAAVLAYAWLLWPALIGRRVLAPTDLLVASRVIGLDSADILHEPGNELLFDPVYVFIPWLEFAARELRRGNLPFWNPYIFCGSPFLAANQSGLFSLWHWLYFLFPGPATLAWIQLVKASAAALGAALALRRLGVKHWAGILLAAVYPLGGFMITWMQYPLSGTAVWLPWVFWSTLGALQRPGLKNSLPLTLTVALLCLAGHLETAAHVLIGTGIFAALTLAAICHRCGVSGAIRRSLWAGLAVVAGLALAAPQIVPTLEYVRQCRRVQLRAQGEIEQTLKHRDQWLECFRLLQPYVFGSRERGSFELRTVCINESGANGFVGASTALLAVAGLLLGGGRVLPLVLTALLCAGPALRLPVLQYIENVPPLNVMNNARLLLITGWCVLCLAALFLDRLARGRPEVPWLMCFAGLVVGGGVLGIVVLADPPVRLLHTYTVEHWPWFRWRLLPTAVASLSLGIGLFLKEFINRKSALLAVLVAVVPLGETVALAYGYNPLVDPGTFYPRTELINALMSRTDDRFRVVGFSGALAPNLGMVYGFRDIRGYDAADPEPYVSFLVRANPKVRPRPYAALARYWLTPGPVANMLSVRWIVTDRYLDLPGWFREGKFGSLYLYENLDALPRAYVPRHAVKVPPGEQEVAAVLSDDFDPRETVVIAGPAPVPEGVARGTVEILEESTDEVLLCVRARTRCVVVLADAWAPGWQVSVDGKPAAPLRANAVLRAVTVSAGHHHVRWRYVAPGFHTGLAICAVAIVGLALVVGWRCSFSRKHEDISTPAGRDPEPQSW